MRFATVAKKIKVGTKKNEKNAKRGLQQLYNCCKKKKKCNSSFALKMYYSRRVPLSTTDEFDDVFVNTEVYTLVFTGYCQLIVASTRKDIADTSFSRS